MPLCRIMASVLREIPQSGLTSAKRRGDEQDKNFTK